jgi:SNF2 family DNA or RNA helicase
LSEEEKALAAEAEALALRTAERNWDDTVDSVRSERADLVWERKRLVEQYALYRELAADTAVQYQSGMVTESEYRKTITNEQRAQYQILASDAQNLIHLIDAALYFVEE